MNRAQLDYVLRLHGLLKVAKDHGWMIVRYAGTPQEPWWVIDTRRDGGFVDEQSTHRLDVAISMIEKFVRDPSYGRLVSVAHLPLGSVKWFPVKLDMDEVYGQHLQPMDEDPDARESGAAKLLSDIDIEAVVIALAVIVLIILVLRLVMRV